MALDAQLDASRRIGGDVEGQCGRRDPRLVSPAAPAEPAQMALLHHPHHVAAQRQAAVEVERRIDELNADLAPLRSFILPGGRPAAAYLHLARTVCRRAECMMVELNDKPGEGVTPAALKYVNRLSDFLFVAGRHANDKGASDVLWQPGQNR